MKLYLPLAALLIALATTLPAQAQVTAVGTADSPNASAASACKTMTKLGLSLGRGVELRSFPLAVPGILGIEQRLSSRFSAYANLVAGLRLGNRHYHDQSAPSISRGIGELGGRYYYNQAKRMQHNRAAGPFVGNYLALQASTDLVPYRADGYDARTHVTYDFSALSALWGMQRRLGYTLVCDVNAGLGICNDKRLKHDSTVGYYSYRRRPTLLPEFNLRLSLVRQPL